MVEALETPTETPRVLLVPQWCVDPEGPHVVEEWSSLDLEDLQEQAEEGTARLCVSHNRIGSSAYVGAGVVEGAVMDVAGRKGGSVGLRGADARQQGLDRRRIKNGASLLKSDAVSPVMVVDMWSAPALFLRHIEVRFCQQMCACLVESSVARYM